MTLDSNLKILIVEDDAYFRGVLKKNLQKYGEIEAVSKFDKAKHSLLKGKFNVAFIDLNLAGKDDGLKLIELSVSHSVIPIVLTGYTQKNTIAKAYSLGARHYFTKLDAKKNIDTLIGPCLEALGRNNLKDFFENEFITQDGPLIKRIDYFRHQNLTKDQRCLILGPTGVGKTKIAKLIHRLNGGEKENFIHVNAAELPDTLAESLLFGHKKGAFTGAYNDKVGFFTQANGGTLFLDEIGTISLPLQKKLLRAVEQGEYTPLGQTKPVKSNFRLITATCENLAKLIEKNEFRVDFYFRIKGIELDIPALKDRPKDIKLLLNYFVSNSTRKIVFSDEAIECLLKYDWYGNVRELEALVNQYIRGHLGLIEKDDLPPNIIHNRNPFKGSSGSKLYSEQCRKYVREFGLKKLIERIEEEAFKDVYNENDGKISNIIRQLKVASTTVYRIQDNVEKSRGVFLNDKKQIH